MVYQQVLERFFSIYKHFNEETFNAKDYKFLVPGFLKNDLYKYSSANKHQLMQYLPYDKQAIMIFAVMNQWLYNKGYDVCKVPSTKEKDEFVHSLIYYEDNLKNDLEYLYENFNSLSSKELCRIGFMNKISKISLFFIVKYLKHLDTDWLSDITIKPRVIRIGKMIQLFNFNEDIIKDMILKSDLQKKMEMEN